MSKKKVAICAAIAVCMIVAVVCALLLLGQGNVSDSTDNEFSVVEPELEGEKSAVETTSSEEFNDDGDADGQGDAAQGADGSNNAGGSFAGGGNAPADDGSTTQGVTYSQYNAMSAEEQQAWFNSFESVEAFFGWYNNAKAVYEANNEAIIIDGNTSIDISDIA